MKISSLELFFRGERLWFPLNEFNIYRIFGFLISLLGGGGGGRFSKTARHFIWVVF